MTERPPSSSSFEKPPPSEALSTGNRPLASSTSVWRGRLLIVAAALMWSTSGFFAKAPIFSDWPIESRGILLAFWRAFFAAVVLIFMVKRIEWSWRLIPMTAVFAIMNWTYLNGMVFCEPTLAIWLQYTAPAWVFLVSWICFRDRPTVRDWLLLVFAAVGVTIILRAELWGASPTGVRYGLASGLFFALVVVTLKWNRDFDAAWLIFLNHTVTALVLAPALFQHGVYPVGWQWAYLFAFGVFQLGLPYILFAMALKSVSSHEASGLTLLEPLLVPVWVYVAWRTSPDYQFPATTTLIGGGLILAGMVVRYFGSRKSRAI